MYPQAHIFNIRFWLCTVFMVLSAVCCGVVQAKMPAAGLKIENIASAQFIDDSGNRYFAVSQPVTTKILPAYAAILTPANDIQANPDQIIIWQHTLTNTGNAQNSFSFNLIDLGGDSGVLKNLTLIHDVNNNGFYDAGDIIINPAVHQESLEAGQKMSLLVKAQVPLTALTDNIFLANIQVKSAALDVPLLSLVDKVYLTAPNLKLIKNVNQTEISVNSINAADKTLKYSLTMRNEGNASALGSTVNIEGANVSKVVFEDTLPSGVTLNKLTYRSGGAGRLLLYHVRGTPDKSYKNYELGTLPDLSTIDRVAVAFDGFFAPQEAILEVDVDVVTTAAISLDNQFLAYYNYGSENKEAYSNIVSTKLLSSLFDLTAANPFVKQPNELAVWKHILSNTGSVNDIYDLSLTQATNDNGNLVNPIIVEDTNGNGVYDPAIDTVVTQVSLSINQKKTLFVVGTVPANAQGNDVFNVNLSATSNNTQQINTKIDSVTAASQLTALNFNLTIVSDIIVLPSQPVVFKHILQNTGLLPDSYSTSAVNLTNDGSDLLGLNVFADSNNNGVYDAGIDSLVTGPIPLNPQQQVTLFVVGTTPADAKLNDKINVALQVQETRTGLSKNVVDTVSVVAATLGSKNGDYSVDKQRVLVTATNPEDIYLEAGVQQCNTRPNVADKVLLRVRSFAIEDSSTILDEEFVIAEEASDKTNSALFRLSNPLKTKSRRDPQTRNLLDVKKLNSVLEVLTTDKVEVAIVHCLEDDGKTVKKDAQNQEMKVYKDFVTKEEVKTAVLIFEPADLKSKNANYSVLKSKILANQKVFLETETEQCNTRVGVVDKLLLRVRSFAKDSQGNYSTTNLDEEFAVAIETGKDTGLFRLENPIPTRSRLEHTPVKQNEILETIAYDKVTATILHCLEDDGKTIKKDEQGQNLIVYKDPINQVGEVSSDLLVDPFGVVFDSQTGNLINGATVKLIRLENGVEVPFKLFDDNNKECEVDVTANLSCKKTIITGTLDINGDGVVDAGDDGMFRFPFVPATDGVNSFYRLVITAPTGYAYPSVLSPTDLFNNPATKNRVINVTGSFTAGDDDGSYGGRFNVLPTDGPVELDIPMDPPAANASSLFIKKERSRANAELGEFVDYTVTVKNVSINNLDINNVVVTDTLPKGFSYVAGTARIGKVAQEPMGGIGPVLRFTIGNMGAKNESTITYRAHIGVGALHGDGINRAQAQGVTPINSLTIQSATAVAKVNVTAGVFTKEAFITGKVYTDCNRDGVQGLEEIGVPNVRLILEDGSYVVTDVEGKYNFYGVRAMTHVLKVDRTSLPQDIELIEQNVRHAGDPSSRFVDLKSGELHRADFAITTDSGTCSGAAMTEIYSRRNQGDAAIGELERALKADLAFETSNPSDLRSLPANGCINQTGNECGLHGKAKMPVLSQANTNKDNKTEDDIERVATPTDTRSLESYVQESATNQLDILNLSDGQILPYAQTRVLFKGSLGATFEISVNDQVLTDKSVGIKMTIPDTQTEAREYIGINLEAGQNRIVLKQFDALGNPRGVRVIHVSAPDKLASITVVSEQKMVEANGSNETLLTVKLLDKNGVPVTSRTAITLEGDAGRFRATDLDPKTQGIQLFVEGGEFGVKLVAPTQAGEANIRVSSGVFKAQTTVRFVPELRPMVAAGIIEGMVSFKNFSTAKVDPAYANDGFEAELQSLASGKDGKLNAGGRAAMFLKGKVKGEYLLTLSYDSNKEKDQRLFRDIRPDDYYPVYGDSAVRGFDAQSTSKLYVRLDKGRSYVMFGDYTTRIDSTEGLSLGQYNRSLTGIRGHYANDSFQATTFVAQTKAKQKVIEIPAQGVSGPYVLTGVDGLRVNSEKVEIIKRDRNNLGLIISTEPQARFTDYEFEPLTSSIYFKAPVPSLDANLNPYAIRVTVEIEEDTGENYWVGGVQVEQKLGKKLTVGAAAVQENDPVDAYQLGSANAVFKLAENTKLIAEVAQSDRDSKPTGNASRAELVHNQGRVNARVYYGESDTDFENPASPLSSGRAESGIKLQLGLDSWGTLNTEAIRTENTTTGGVRHGVKATLTRTLNQYLSAEFGGRLYDETAVPANNTNLGVTPYEGKTIHTKLNIKIPKVEAASVYGEYEQDVDHSERKIIALGGDYKN